MLFVRLFVLLLLVFVLYSPSFVSGSGCDLCLWHSLDLFFFYRFAGNEDRYKFSDDFELRQDRTFYLSISCF